MLMLLSPSKTQDFTSILPEGLPPTTQPDFLKHSAQLVALLRTLPADALGELMAISPKLAALNAQRYQEWRTPFDAGNARPALYAFKGDVYDGLDAPSLSMGSVAYAQTHLRMLSGLYGLLRPLDYMQPYRLEMGTSLANAKGKHLYAFWGATLSAAVSKAASSAGTDVVLNLASEEYSRAIDPAALKQRWVSPQFKEEKGNSLRVLGLFAKRARGMMARHVLEQRIERLEDLASFTAGGYRYRKDLSTAEMPVFTRPQPAAKAA